MWVTLIYPPEKSGRKWPTPVMKKAVTSSARYTEKKRGKTDMRRTDTM